MPGFDWNGNGRHDHFDSFMDMKVMSDISESNSSDSDESNSGSDNGGYLGGYGGNYVSHVSSKTYNETIDPNMSIQEQLRKDLRSPETVKREYNDRKIQAMREDAKCTLRDIKCALVNNAKEAKYSIQNGVTTVYCFCEISQRFMRSRREDNGNQLRQNQQTFFLFRDPNLIYKTWNCYEVNPQYSTDFSLFMISLKELAAAEGITVESVVFNYRDNKFVPFPSKARNDYSPGWRLCIRAATNIDSTGTPSPQNSSSGTNYSQPINALDEEKLSEQKTGDSNGTVIVKSLLVIGLCVAAFAICMAADLGKLGMGLLLIGAAIGGYHILK